ncbi:MAG: hypothetical protein EA425_05745 [Puniceicoccaceae bacterium]|nr:MAG: hypothetical protein EA425_05745 [Puniceicoccaceae bacterium]
MEAPGTDLQHPYLFFSAEDIPALQARVQDPAFLPRWNRLLIRANSLLNQSPSTNPRLFQGDSALLGFAYIITGDVRYAERAIEGALAVAALNTWGTGFVWNRGADLETSEQSTGMAFVYDWCHDVLTPAQRTVLRDATVAKGINPYLSSINPNLSPNWWVNHPVNNWRGVCHGGSILAALAFYGVSPEARAAAELGYHHLEPALRAHFLADSGGHEGVTYNNYGIEYVLMAAAAHQRFFGGFSGLLRELADDRLGAYWDVYMHAPDLHFANLGRMHFNWGAGLWSLDGRNEGGPSSLRAALTDSMVPGGDRLLRWAADNGGQRFYWHAASPLYFIWRRDAPSLYREARPELQEAVLFRDAGHAVLQSGDLYLAFSGGAAHNRGDVGAFVLLVGNERLIHLEPSLNHLGSAFQSTLLVNGQGQQTGGPPPRGDYLHFGSGEGFHYLAAEIAPLYPASVQLTRAVRHLVMVRGRFVVLLDDLAAAQPVQFEHRFQTTHPLQAGTDAVRIVGQQRDLYLIGGGVDAFQRSLGSGAALNHVAYRRLADEGTLLTVLYPTSSGGPPPQVSVEDGVLTLTAGGETDVVAFSRASGEWTLAAVNAVAADLPPYDGQRTVVPYRDGRDDAAEVPPWLLRRVGPGASAPTGLTAAVVADGWIQLDWEDGVDNALAYHVERRAEGESDWTLVAELPGDAETFAEDGLPAGTVFFYRVFARTPFADSPVATATVQTWTELQAWRHLHFGTTENTGVAADFFQPLEDGWPNLLKYLTGLNPLEPAGRLLEPELAADGALVLRVPFAGARADARLEIQQSGDLQEWVPVAEEQITAVDGELEVKLAADGAGPAVFIRIKAIREP